MTDRRTQTVTGLVPPQLDEAVIRVVWPSVSAFPAIASLGRALMGKRVGDEVTVVAPAGAFNLKILDIA